jgi:hypothetical protein
MSAPPYWKLGEDKPTWYLGDLREEPRIRQTRAPIYREVSAAPVVIERSAVAEEALLSVKFALFDRWQEINSPYEGRFLERIALGAFRKTIRENFDHIRAILSHGKDPSLGSTVLGRIATSSNDRAVHCTTLRGSPRLPARRFGSKTSGPQRSRHTPRPAPRSEEHESEDTT